MMDLNRVPLRNKSVVYQIVNDEAVLVLPAEGKVKVLNKVGAFIWQQVDNQKTVKEIVDLVVEGFDVSHERAASDTLRFLEELVSKAVIEV
jgi:methyltransferase-like protein